MLIASASAAAAVPRARARRSLASASVGYHSFVRPLQAFERALPVGAVAGLLPLLISASNAQVRQCLDQLLRAARGGELAASKTLASSTLRRKGSSRFFFSCICLQVYYISSKDAYKIRPQYLGQQAKVRRITGPPRRRRACTRLVWSRPHLRNVREQGNASRATRTRFS